MSTSAISKRYAQALVELAAEQELVEQTGTELEAVTALLARERALRLLMESPTLATEKKQAIFADIADKMQLSAIMRNFVGLLVQKDRMRYVKQITTDYRALADARSGIVRALVTSATKLTKNQADLIRQGLEQQTGCTVDLQLEVDSSLIGGLKAQVGDKVFDGSIKTQLNRIEDTLKKG
ncbi:ATP synthase F1 subunit delta [Desulfuromonas thiophila]|uniref:ATP synthase F1 subunit delta n=1 Tax=Desulfuromonas thiophila TaxID=57664 RepID=UPI0024A855BD|nr:ATP synthase F1 subunit delta [Desulfuromonas thiophila]